MSFLLAAEKVMFVNLLCISSQEDMCSEVLLAKQRLARHMPFFRDFWCVYNMTFVFFLSTQNVLCLRQCYIHNRADEFKTVCL